MAKLWSAIRRRGGRVGPKGGDKIERFGGASRGKVSIRQYCQHLVPCGFWEDIKADVETVKELKGIFEHASSHLASGGKKSAEPVTSSGSTTVLFYGGDVTTKTIAAQVLANYLKCDLFHIDLSLVTSKYIGETEKNLNRVFRQGSQSRAILFFDEADALFGKRSGVRDSHDRFANVEANYLLKRIRDYGGMVILASNQKYPFEDSFLRSFRFTVNFPVGGDRGVVHGEVTGSYPGVRVEDVPPKIRHIDGVSTSVTAFVGRTVKGVVNEPVMVESFCEYEEHFGGLSHESGVSYAVHQFFANGGKCGVVVRVDGGFDKVNGVMEDKTGMYALGKCDAFNLLCIPPLTVDGCVDVPVSTWVLASKYCVGRKAFLLMDAPVSWSELIVAKNFQSDLASLNTVESENAAVYFPRLLFSDPLADGETINFVASGGVAGVMARIDSGYGVWKAPVGQFAVLEGVEGLGTSVTDKMAELLNLAGVNCIKSLVGLGAVCWGGRTLEGREDSASEYKYISIRRLSLFIEESVERGLDWVVFEPNGEQLWNEIRMSVGVFLLNLWRDGALVGSIPEEAYFVKCDSETTTDDDLVEGRVNILVGFAPMKAAEFMVLKIQKIISES